jgi:hypothetical protein
LVKNLVFGVLFLIIITTCSLDVSRAYITIKQTERKNVSLATSVGLVVSSLSSLFLLINALLRIRKTSKSEIAISKMQIAFHIGSFSLYSIAYIAILGVSIHIRYMVNKRSSEVRAEETDISESSIILVVALS